VTAKIERTIEAATNVVEPVNQAFGGFAEQKIVRAYSAGKAVAPLSYQRSVE
jgi:hypothetical protein